MPTAATASRRRRLELLRPSGWFVPDHDMDGAHLSSGLTVTVDVTGWPVDVSVPEAMTGLRTPEELRDAVLGAVEDAMANRRVAGFEQQPLSLERRERVEDYMSGRERIEGFRVTRFEPIEAPRHIVQGSAPAQDEVLERRFVGRSAHGEVEVVLSLPVGLEDVRVDPDFVIATDAMTLRYALREAFRAADELCERSGY